MIKYISSWAEQVIVAVIIGTILEMILPKGNSKRYIKTLIGIYILYTIITPFVTSITGKKLNIDYSDYDKYFNNTNNYSEISTLTIEDTYKREIKNQIEKDIKDLGYIASKIDFEFNLEKGEFEQIEIHITKEENKDNSKISINKVEIGSSKYEENTLSSKEIERIKEIFVQNYGITYEKIIVNSI